MRIYLFFFVFLGTVCHCYCQKTLSDEEISTLVKEHNYWRSEVGLTSTLSWSDTLANYAAEWAKMLKKKGCAFEHRPDNRYGENLFMGTSGFFVAKDVVTAWGNEKNDYNHQKNKCKSGKMCGHYTQIVWESTQRVGCAKIQCDGNDLWVCNYDPPGNWVGQRPYK